MTNRDLASSYHHTLEMVRAGSVELAIEKLKRQSRDGDAHADAFLGAIHEFGLGTTPSDVPAALDWYERAIRKGAPLEAYLGIARIRLEGPESLRNVAYAKQLLEELVANTSAHPVVWVVLGYAYLNNCQTRCDLDKAEDAFSHAIEGGNAVGYAGIASVLWRKRQRFRSIVYRLKGAIRGLSAPEQARRW